MFESAVVRTRTGDRRLMILSVIAHSAIIAAVLAASLSSTRVPTEAPKQMMPVVFAAPLPVMTSPNPAPASPKAAPPKGSSGQARLPVLHPIVAPVVIPSLVLPASPPATDSGPAGPVGVAVGKDNSTGTNTSAPAAADASGPLVAGTGGVTKPVAIHRVEPIYPPAAIRAHMPGVVVVECIIDKSGRVRDVRVIHSSFGLFEKPAIDAVQQWVFTPGTLNGQPVDVVFEFTVRFEVR